MRARKIVLRFSVALLGAGWLSAAGCKKAEVPKAANEVAEKKSVIEIMSSALGVTIHTPAATFEFSRNRGRIIPHVKVLRNVLDRTPGS